MKEKMKNFVRNHKKQSIAVLIMIVVVLAATTAALAIRSILKETNDVKSANGSLVGTATDAAGTETDAKGTATDAILTGDEKETTGDGTSTADAVNIADGNDSGLPENEFADQEDGSEGNSINPTTETKMSVENANTDGNDTYEDTYSETEITEDVLLQYAYDVIDLINAERDSQGLQPFEINDDLMTAASIRVNEYVSNYKDVEAYVAKYGFGHPRPDGRDSDTVMEDLGYTNLAFCIEMYGCDDDTSGKYIFSYNENLARGFTSASETVAAWMADEHRYLILDEGTSLYSPIEVEVSYDEKWMNVFCESGSLTGTDVIGAAVAYVNGTFYWSVSTATLPHEHDFSGEVKSMMDVETYRNAMYVYDDLDNWESGRLIYTSGGNVPGYSLDVGLNRTQYIEYLWKEASYYTCKYCGAMKWVYRD